MVRRLAVGLFLTVIVLGTLSCHRVLVPPEYDLERYGTVGLIQFTSTNEGSLGALTTQRFIRHLTRDQKLSIIELGTKEQVLKAVGQDHLGPDAAKAIGQKYGVKVFFTGELDVSRIMPRVEIFGLPAHWSVAADVDVSLLVRLLDTDQGATQWSGSRRESREVGEIGMHGGHFMFDAQDPEHAYGDLVESLVDRVTRDFRAHWRYVCR